MIADLDSGDFTGGQRLQLSRKKFCALLYSRECARNIAATIENRWFISVFGEGFFPSG
jgi:hypothetical protein